MNRTFVIAECGSCHDGDLERAQLLIQRAKAAGADAAKFQFWSSADRMAERRRVPDYYREIYRRYQVAEAWLPTLAIQCQLQGIELMCSTYLPEDVATVAPFVKRFKVASFEAADPALLAAHGRAHPDSPSDRSSRWKVAHTTQEQPLIVSVGMMDSTAAARVRACLNDGDAMLLCTSAYPAPYDALNLAWLRHLIAARDYDCCGLHNEHHLHRIGIGLSDHSHDIRVGAIAVAAGAEIIEAHLRLDDTDPANPDYATAFDYCDFRIYVDGIRFAERVMGEAAKTPQPCEADMAQYRVTA